MSEWIITAAGLSTAVLSIAGLIKFVVRPLWRGLRRIDAFLSDWGGEPARPGRERIPSMPERMKTVEVGLAAVRSQVTPNGGNSRRLGDRMVRVERALGTEPEELPNAEH